MSPDAPTSFESAGREELAPPEETDAGREGFPLVRDMGKLAPTVFWGDDEGPTVMVWDGILPEEQEIVKVIREENDWII